MKKTLLLLAALLLAGCASKPPEISFPVTPKMATTFAGGETTITWKAELNQLYTIYYTDAPPGKLPDWKPLPQGAGIKGTGKTITVSDKAGAARRYLLLTGDQKPY